MAISRTWKAWPVGSNGWVSLYEDGITVANLEVGSVVTANQIGRKWASSTPTDYGDD